MKSIVQEETCEWISRLEELAVQCDIKLRLLDAIRDCKRELEQEFTEAQWRQKCLEIDELLEQVRKQLVPQISTSNLEPDIALRISEILMRCRNSNDLLLSEYCSSAGSYVQEAENSLLELSNVKVNYTTVTNSASFLGAFSKVGQKFKMQLDQQSEKYVGSADRNYTDVFDRLSGLFSGTGFDERAKQIFYKTYYENMDILARDVKEYARVTDKGEGKISRLAEKILAPLEKLLSSLARKAFFLKLLPVFILVLGLGVGLISSYVVYTGTQANQEQDIEVVEDEADISTYITKELLPRFISTGAERDEENGTSIFVFGKLKVFAIVIVIAGVLYFLYVLMINRWHRAKICSQAGKLLAISIEEFQKEDTLMLAVKEGYQQINGYMRKQYENILSGLLPGLTQEGEDDSKMTMFRALCSDWNNLRRKELDH